MLSAIEWVLGKGKSKLSPAVWTSPLNTFVWKCMHVDGNACSGYYREKTETTIQAKTKFEISNLNVHWNNQRSLHLLHPTYSTNLMVLC